MGFLTPNDYLVYIQSAIKAQLVGKDTAFDLVEEVEKHAIYKMRSLLIQKYDVDYELKEAILYEPNIMVKAAQRIYLDAKVYLATTTYAINALTLQNGNVYKCITPITTPEPFNVSKWQLLGAQYTLFYAITPKPEFDYYTQYNQGDEVFYKDKVYIAQTSTKYIFPDDKQSGLYYWGVGTNYSVNTNALLDTDAFTQGDNRSPLLVKIAVDLSLYNMHRRIAPMNVPDNRKAAYQDSIIELEQFAEGKATLEARTKQPIQGRRVRYGTINSTRLRY